MRQYHRRLTSFRANERGATTIEFAIVSIPFFLLFLGIIEFGMFMLAQVTLESAVGQAGRASSISTLTDDATAQGGSRVQVVESIILNKASGGLIHRDQIFFSENILAAAQPTPPDVCFTTVTHIPIKPAPPQCGTDDTTYYIKGDHSNRLYVQPGNADSGGVDADVVEVRATYPWHVLFPIFGQYFGDHGTVLISASTVVRNEGNAH